MSSKPNQAWNGHKYFFLVDFTFTFHAGTRYFFCYLRGEPNAKTSYLHCSLVLCGKMQTVFSVQRHKKARTLSLVFCLTEPFSLPVTPNPPPTSSSYSLPVPSTNGPLCVRKYTTSQKKKTTSNLLRELQVFNIRLLNDWPDTHSKEDALFEGTGNEKALLSFSRFAHNFTASSIVFS